MSDVGKRKPEDQPEGDGPAKKKSRWGGDGVAAAAAAPSAPAAAPAAPAADGAAKAPAAAGVKPGLPVDLSALEKAKKALELQKQLQAKLGKVRPLIRGPTCARSDFSFDALLKLSLRC
jgi:hypothetical protein